MKEYKTICKGAIVNVPVSVKIYVLFPDQTMNHLLTGLNVDRTLIWIYIQDFRFLWILEYLHVQSVLGMGKDPGNPSR